MSVALGNYIDLNLLHGNISEQCQSRSESFRSVLELAGTFPWNQLYHSLKFMTLPRPRLSCHWIQAHVHQTIGQVLESLDTYLQCNADCWRWFSVRVTSIVLDILQETDEDGKLGKNLLGRLIGRLVYSEIDVVELSDHLYGGDSDVHRTQSYVLCHVDVVRKSVFL